MRILYLSRNYPNPSFPLIGLWVEGLVRAMSGIAEVRVVAPAPYCPPLPARFSQTRFRTIPRRRMESGVEVLSPRFIVGPGYTTYSLEADSYYLAIQKTIDRLRKEFEFEVIHAQFVPGRRRRRETSKALWRSPTDHRARPVDTLDE